MELPPCPYRQEGRCSAEEDRPITPEDCWRCPIPEALAHPQACLYLVPFRMEGTALFACRFTFTWAREPAVADWRCLCPCPYWFPRAPEEAWIRDLRSLQDRYRRVLKGEEPRYPPLVPPKTDSRRRRWPWSKG
ncbi:hypothetical protein CSW25_03700 [Thermus scotoductus]|uniref:Uncharacterized protein n=5 Tax=Thermus TaxID=270 RepID=A0A430ULP8_THESC|nr:MULTISPECIES: hypothetical protein [Thermus]ADW21720.1 hypothetical protein TSC_c10980 [Thermus scotoductus SA-01]MBW6394014.1 hypothetical protein [Thermus brevis]RTH17549.1 hypothetical protein CSW39_07140 [Thermus scotoductus]RTH30678.1 hypothetical protein CSW35_10095 [Thermus scotoductus]RTI05060.1 hypothetical protein CSW30_12195 [Thermus scotoductus]